MINGLTNNTVSVFALSAHTFVVSRCIAHNENCMHFRLNQRVLSARMV